MSKDPKSYGINPIMQELPKLRAENRQKLQELAERAERDELRAEVERLRAALVKISTFGNTGHGPYELASLAARALGHEQKDTE